MYGMSLAVALLMAAPPTSPDPKTDILPLAEVRPGMRGVGRTVFEGTRIDEFDVEIIGVLENTAPKRSMILARLDGGPLERTGVIAGMSGSPVLIDGKLIGAVAYGFPFSKETIAGITPIGEMIEATRTRTPRAASARLRLSSAHDAPSLPLDRESFVAVVRDSLSSLAPVSGALSQHSPGASLAPLPLPMVFSGFHASTVDWARGVFSNLGLAPVLGPSGGTEPLEPLPDLEPGSAVAVSLVEGDLDLSVTGTVTHIDGDRVYAFGHPFYNLGPTQFPMKKAYVYSVFPSLYQSWKISTAREAVGTMEQDRVTAIAGRLDAGPQMIPLEVRLTTSRGHERRFSMRVVQDELLSPALVYMSLLSVLQGTERALGTSTIRMQAKLAIQGGREITVDDLFTGSQPAAQAAALVAAPMAFLLANDLEKVEIDRVDVDIVSHEILHSAVLERAWIERSGPVRPGSSVPLKLLFRTRRGDTVSETIPVSVPATAPAGRYSLLVADGSALTAFEQRQMRQRFVPRTLDQLIRAINGLRHNHYVYARLLRTEDGAIVSGEWLQSLPPSVLSVLGSGDQGSTVTRIRTTSVWEFDLKTDYAVSGSRRLNLVVER